MKTWKTVFIVFGIVMVLFVISGVAYLSPIEVEDKCKPQKNAPDMQSDGVCLVELSETQQSNPKSEIRNQQIPILQIQNLSPTSIGDPKSGVALREEFVGARVNAIQGEDPSVTKVNYFKGNDPEKWKSNISAYDMVNLGETYKGIDLKLKAYGDNVEKLFCVKPGADPEQIKISLSGIQPPESPLDFVVSAQSNEKGARGCPPLAGVGGGLWVNEEGQLVAETELGPVKFTKPVAYQEINGKRVEVEVEVEYKVESLQLKDENTKCETRN